MKKPNTTFLEKNRTRTFPKILAKNRTIYVFFILELRVLFLNLWQNAIFLAFLQQNKRSICWKKEFLF